MGLFRHADHSVRADLWNLGLALVLTSDLELFKVKGIHIPYFIFISRVFPVYI